MSKKSKTVEDTYKKLTQLEHVLVRPDTYIGSIEIERQTLWILDEDGSQLVEKEIDNVPGLYKIFDEILVNAADNYQRTDGAKRMDEIRVVIDREQNMISVKNNGKGIPVVIHKEYDIYVPELIFGNLLTGSNYDDNQEKVVGGRNGYGAKLANIFSQSFVVECGDGSQNKKEFRMEWRNNMQNKSDPVIKNYKGEDYTCITFQPDIKRFKLKKITEDLENLLKKRVYDLAGIFNGKVKVYLNNKRINIKTFKDYINMYIPDIEDKFKIYDKSMTNERWEILVSFSDGQPKQVSFVNGICTSRGGTHVQYILDKIVDEIKKGIQKKNKKVEIKPHMIKQHLWIFVNSLIVNPTFDSQTKETLTKKASSFGSKPEISEAFIKKIVSSGVIDTIINQAKAKENDKLLKTMKGGKKSSRLLGIPKLEDANCAGTRKSEDCTIILTEGDSAKALAMAGIEVVGRDNYGVFPLRGKMLNVRDADPKQILKNEEIQNLIKIIGLKAKEEYSSLKELRYGSVMIMTDQDVDGSHIKGLIINMFQKFWPTLFSYKGFLREFVTPIVKCKHKRNQENVVKFFSLTDYKRWEEETRNPQDYKVKYYKGLGTSENKEAIEYFEDIDEHQIDFEYVDSDDDDVIDMIFSKKKAEQRKTWLQNYDPDIAVDYAQAHRQNNEIKKLRYTDFVNQEFIHFSSADNLRSIPSFMDGFKPGQRKILYACFKRNLKDEIKVAQLSGYVAEKSAYHHGEVSLQGTIIGMAQNFVGSNNINLLLPIGQFGTRNMGGKEHASARYLYTNLNKITRKIFPEADDHTLKYLEDDGNFVEPEYYVPVIPLGLINGAEGIGTGWSTNVPCYNPRDCVENIKRKLEGKDFTDMTPWYRGFQGEIISTTPSSSQGNTKKYTMKGIMEEKEDEEDIIDITELPVGVWTRNFKNDLEKLMKAEDDTDVKKDDRGIKDLREYHAQDRIHFQLEVDPKKWNKTVKKKVKIEKPLSTSNMVFFNTNNALTKYQNTIEILEEYFNVRLEFYDKRKEYLISKLEREIEINDNKMKYINLIIQDKIKYKNVKKKFLVQQLMEKGLTPMSKIIKIQSTKLKVEKKEQKVEKKDSDSESDDEEEIQDTISPKEYDYLCQMPMWNLTKEKIKKLQDLIDLKKSELKTLENTTLKDMWINDLDEFLETLEEVEEQDERDRLAQRTRGKGKKGKGKKGGPRKAAGPGKRKKKAPQDSDSDAGTDFRSKIRKKKKGADSDTESVTSKTTTKGKKTKKKDDDSKSVTSNDSIVKDPKKKKKEKSEMDLPLEERLKLKQSKLNFKEDAQRLKENEKNKEKSKPTQGKKIKKLKNQIDSDDDDEDDFKIGKSNPSKQIHAKGGNTSDSETEFAKISKNKKIIKKSEATEEQQKRATRGSRKVLKVLDSDSEEEANFSDYQDDIQEDFQDDDDDDDEEFEF